MADRLAGKVAVITGGVSGMGLATVHRFVEEGARVVIGDVQDGPGERIAREIGSAVFYQHCDVSRDADVAALVERAVTQYGRLDCMFNNAGFGGYGGEVVTLDVNSPAYRRTIDVLFTGVLSGIRHAAPVMKGQGGGSIINTSSVAGLRGGYSGHIYSAMKAAVINLSKSTALELGPSGIRVNAICPGSIATAIFVGSRNMSYEQKQQFVAEMERGGSTLPMRRMGRGSDIADTALFLASDESSFITGQAITVDGGLTAGNRREPGRRSPTQLLADRMEAEARGAATT
jgi:NAD(P)-dependent dehydrogenase (short-subunit alcohol dehydrogenase family)